MPYPPPPGWFPHGQGFPPGPPGGPAPWGNAPFPPGPGGPPGPDPQNQRGPLSSGPTQPQPASVPEQPKIASPPPQVATPTESKAPIQPTRQPKNAPTPPVASKPSVEEVKATASNLASEAFADAPATTKPAPTGPRNNRVNPVIPLSGASTKPFQPLLAKKEASQATVQTTVTATQSSVEDATSAARAAVAVAMAQLGNSGGGNAMDNLTNKVNEMRVNAVRGGQADRGRGRGGRTAPRKVEVPESDFDFAQSNAKFNKGDIVKEATAGSALTETANGNVAAAEDHATPDGPAAYSKSRSFFDNISSDARERAENNGHRAGGREWRDEEQRRNMETFGQGSVDGGHRNFRGRGRGRGRGGRGRGFHRGGGHGDNPPPYRSTAEN